jgi:hypothetical protein
MPHTTPLCLPKPPIFRIKLIPGAHERGVRAGDETSVIPPVRNLSDPPTPGAPITASLRLSGNGMS